MPKKIFIYIIAILFSATACIDEDDFSNSYSGNFEALWNIIDERYCFFGQAEKAFGLDWN